MVISCYFMDHCSYFSCREFYALVSDFIVVLMAETFLRTLNGGCLEVQPPSGTTGINESLTREWVCLHWVLWGNRDTRLTSESKSRSAVHRVWSLVPAVLTLFGNLLEMKIFGLHSRPSESETPVMGLSGDLMHSKYENH